MYSLGTREMIGDIYSFDIRQINILYCYITHTHPCQHSPATTLHSTRLPHFQTDDHLALMLSQVSSIASAPSTPRGGCCSNTISLHSRLYTYPQGKPKTYLNKSICKFGLRSTQVWLVMPFSQGTCKLVPGHVPTGKMLATQTRNWQAGFVIVMTLGHRGLIMPFKSFPKTWERVRLFCLSIGLVYRCIR